MKVHQQDTRKTTIVGVYSDGKFNLDIGSFVGREMEGSKRTEIHMLLTMKGDSKVKDRFCELLSQYSPNDYARVSLDEKGELVGQLLLEPTSCNDGFLLEQIIRETESLGGNDIGVNVSITTHYKVITSNNL